jgi:hypothetical protein
MHTSELSGILLFYFIAQKAWSRKLVVLGIRLLFLLAFSLRDVMSVKLAFEILAPWRGVIKALKRSRSSFVCGVNSHNFITTNALKTKDITMSTNSSMPQEVLDAIQKLDDTDQGKCLGGMFQMSDITIPQCSTTT